LGGWETLFRVTAINPILLLIGGSHISYFILIVQYWRYPPTKKCTTNIFFTEIL